MDTNKTLSFWLLTFSQIYNHYSLLPGNVCWLDWFRVGPFREHPQVQQYVCFCSGFHLSAAHTCTHNVVPVQYIKSELQKSILQRKMEYSLTAPSNYVTWMWAIVRTHMCSMNRGSSMRLLTLIVHKNSGLMNSSCSKNSCRYSTFIEKLFSTIVFNQ